MSGPLVAHFRNEYLPLTETFIHDLLAAAPGHRPLLVFRRRLNEGHFPLPSAAVQTAADFYRPADGVEELASELGRLGVEACHAEFGWDQPLAGEVAERLNVPLVVSFHGADATSRVLDPRWRDRYRRWLPAAAAVTVAYSGLAERLLPLGARPERVHVIPTLADGEAWPLSARPSRSGPVRLLAVGRLIEKKGQVVLLQALARASQEQDLRLQVAGDGPLRETLEAEVRRLGLASRVKLLGAVSREAVRDLMAASDALVQPSLTAADGEEEGLPVVIKEAACSGLPVVATRHAGIPEVVREGETGFLAEERDPASLAAALGRLLEARERWAEMGEAGRDLMLKHAGRERVLGLWAELWPRVQSVSSSRSTSSFQ